MNETVFELRYVSDHPAADGHFDDYPVIPGVTILSDLVGAIRIAFEDLRDMRYEITNCKFLSPVEPGDTIQVTVRRKSLTTHYECVRVNGKQEVTAKGSFRFFTEADYGAQFRDE